LWKILVLCSLPAPPPSVTTELTGLPYGYSFFFPPFLKEVFVPPSRSPGFAIAAHSVRLRTIAIPFIACLPLHFFLPPDSFDNILFVLVTRILSTGCFFPYHALLRPDIFLRLSCPFSSF